MTFFSSTIDVLQTLVIALGGGLGVWGGINLLEGYARLLGEKKAAYAEYRAAREEMRELMVHRKNLSLILQGDAKEGKGKEAEREGR